MNACEILALGRVSPARCDNVVLLQMVIAWSSADNHVVCVLSSAIDPAGEGLPILQPAIPPPQCSAPTAHGVWLHFSLSLALLHRLTIPHVHFHLSHTFQLEVQVHSPWEPGIAESSEISREHRGITQSALP